MNSPQKIVVVGATSAIAHQCSRLWAQQGPCDFLLVGRSAERAEILAADLRARSAHVTARVAELRFDDVDAMVAKLAAAGVEIIEQPRNAHNTELIRRVAFCRDPDGIQVELIERQTDR